MDASAKCHYEVLGVRRNATLEEIKKAYKKLALEKHPDKNPDDTTEATRAFQALQQAHETLTNPEKRAKYDEQQTAPPQAEETNSDSSSGSSGSSEEEEDFSASEAEEYNSCYSSESSGSFEEEEDLSDCDEFTSATPSADASAWTITAIQNLNLLTAYGAAIRARVTKKTDVKTWTDSNSRGQGTWFSMDLLDNSGEIRMTGFHAWVELFYDKLKVNQVYYIRWFNVKPANKKFTTIKHACELTFSRDTEVIPCKEDPLDIPQPQVTYNFVFIADIEHVDVGKIIDVLGVCKSVTDCQNGTSRNTGREFKKRELVLVDRTRKEIVLTLWGKTAEDFSHDTKPIIAVKGVQVSDFGGKSLSCLNSSVFDVNPDVVEAHDLREWYESEGSSLTTQSLSSARFKGSSAPWKLAVEANEVTFSDMEESDIFMCKVTLMAIKGDNAVYKACTVDNCYKKVEEIGNGMYRCEKCAAGIPTFKTRLVLQCHFADFTGQFMATCFHETGEVVLNEKGDTLGQLYFDKREEFDVLIKNALFQQYIGKFSSKMKKVTVLELTRINHGEYAKQLLNEIRECSS